MIFIQRLKACALLLVLLFAGCTVLPAEKSTDAKNGATHQAVLPAVMICFLAVCEAQYADRAERSDGDLNEGSTTDSKQDEQVQIKPTP